MNRAIIDRFTQYAAKYKYIEPHLGLSILDIGCGNGSLIPFLPEKAAYTGIDTNEETINAMKLKYPQFSFFRLNLDEEPLSNFDKNRFSSIVMSAVIEHLGNPDSVVRQCKTLMSADTKLIITTPTNLGDWTSRTIEKTFFRTGYLQDTHPHLRHYNKRQLTSLGTGINLKCIYFRYLGWHRQNQLAIYIKTVC